MSHLQQTALGVIGALQALTQYSDLWVAVIGGAARVHYEPLGRRTDDVDFIVDNPVGEMDFTSKIRKALLEMHNSEFVQETDILFYVLPGAVQTRCRVDFIERYTCPYFPPGAQQVRSITVGEIPYIRHEDLVVFKTFSCGRRGLLVKAKADAQDAEELLGMAPVALNLDPHQKDIVEAGLPDVLTYRTNRTQFWWKRRLGLSTP